MNARPGRPRALAVAVVLAAVAASLLWWDAAGQLRAPAALSAQAAAGGAIAGQWSPPRGGAPPASYRVRVVAADSGQQVAAVQAWSPAAVVGGLAPGRRYRLAVAAAPGGAEALSAPVTVLADRAPDPPVSVSLSQQPRANTLLATWVPAAGGVAATGAIVHLFDGDSELGYLTCQAGCTTAAFHGLPFGRRYTVGVVPANPVGQGLAAMSNPVDLQSPCPDVAACVGVDATKDGGPARHRASGFLNSLYPVGDMLARVRALGPYSWRGSPVYRPATVSLDWSSWDAAVATGAPTTMLLSNLWSAATETSGLARTPWSDWAAYRTWVTATVRSIEASGHRVSYWEIQNEPGGGAGYFNTGDWAASTPADYLEQFRVAYEAIKAADPAADVLGPSLSHFADYPGEYNTHEPDLVTFLDFAARHGLRLAAITWHEIDDGLGPRPRDFNLVPAVIADHVAEARRLIADRPALGHPQVWVNEYGHHMDYAIPGWALGDIAALEGASVDRAGRSCWPEQGDNAPPIDDCPSPTLDGLLALDGSTPRANYWVYATYAAMKGRLVVAASSDASVAVLAGRDQASGQVTVMVGRDVSCLPGANLSCSQPGAAVPAAAAVAVAVRVPWAAGQVQVTIRQVPVTWGPLPEPPEVFRGAVAVSAGLATFRLPAVADGDVYLITVSRAAAA